MRVPRIAHHSGTVNTGRYFWGISHERKWDEHERRQRLPPQGPPAAHRHAPVTELELRGADGRSPKPMFCSTFRDLIAVAGLADHHSRPRKALPGTHRSSHVHTPCPPKSERAIG